MYAKVILGGITAIALASTLMVGAVTDARDKPVVSRLATQATRSPSPIITKKMENPWEAIKVPQSPGSGGEGGVANVDYSTGFDASEGFVLGPIVGQIQLGPNGGRWCRLGFVPGCPGGPPFDAPSMVDPSVSNINPLMGVEQHLRMAGDGAFPPGTTIRAISPTQVPYVSIAQNTVELCVFISNDLGADYHVRPASPTQGLVSSWVVFHYDDFAAALPDVGDADAVGPDICVLDDPLGPPSLAFYATGTEWVPGVYMRLMIVSDPAANTILYYYDAGPKGAVLGAPIYVGTVYAATTVENVQFYSDNFQLAAEACDVDCFNITTKALPGACCDGTTCTEVTANACALIPGAMFQGPGTSCTPNPCVCACVTATDCRNNSPPPLSTPICSGDNACNCAACINNVCVFTCSVFGNTNCAEPVDLDDILCALSGFGNFASCPSADIHPCGCDGVIDLDDILDVLAAFGGANPCGCNPNGTPPLCGSIQP